MPSKPNRLTTLTTLLAGLSVGLICAPSDAQDRGAPPVTTITVDWSIDEVPGSNTHTCTYSQGGLFQPAPDGRCTFRRALREAGARPDQDRPILLEFSGLTFDPLGGGSADDINYDETLGVWTLPIESGDALPDLERQTILDTDGSVTISGAGMMRGLSGLPGVFIELTSPLSIAIQNNIVEDLGFFGGSSIRILDSGNTVRGITWGLSTDGTELVFQDDPPDQSLAGAQGVFVSLNGDNALIEDSVISGASTKAIEVNSGSTGVIIRNNYIGTRADGTVPNRGAFECQAVGFNYEAGDWYGGWGISLAGSSATITGNLLAGMQNLRSVNDTPPMAIEVFGADHTISDNVIGASPNGSTPGVCGQGIKFSGTGHEVADNTIVRARNGFENTKGALLWSDDTFTDDGGNTVRGNLSIDGPEKLYEMGPQITSTIRLFQPAVVTSLVATQVSGTAAAGSPCANCIIDFYIDDLDADAEALTYAGSLTADSSGNFSGSLSASPSPAQALRTMTTSVAFGQVGPTDPGTTSEPSTDLYAPDLSSLVFYDGFESGNTSAWSGSSP